MRTRALLVGLAALATLPLATSATPPASIVDAKFELFVSDVDASIEFYALLGFQVAQRKRDDYTTLHSGGTVVALSPLPGWLPLHWLGWLRRPPLGTEIVLYTEQLERLHQALVEAGHEPSGIERRAWGDVDFRITDPDGYYVRVSEGSALPPDPEEGER